MLHMKRLCVILLLISMSTGALAAPYYVVLASFSDETKARRFQASIQSLFPAASRRFDSHKAIHHVLAVEGRTIGEAEMLRREIQQIAGFSNAWIFADTYASALTDQGHATVSNGVVKLELYTGSSVLLSSSENSYLSIAQNKGEVELTTRDGLGKAFIFFAKTPSGNQVKAQVAVLDQHGNALSVINTGQATGFYGKNVPDVLKLVCDVPGYNPEVKLIDVTRPGTMSDYVQNKDSVWQLTFYLTKQTIDEVSLRYCDLFYLNAAVLQPSAETSMDKLATLLKENPDWAIVINTHCDSGLRRDIVIAAPEDLFDRTLARSKYASDKQLTRERGRVMHDYLVEAGIDSKRIRLMGWGSLDRLVRDPGADTRLNERVDVEVMMTF